MVDVSNKEVTHRTACARALVVFPEDLLSDQEALLQTKKGPVIDTAIVAGVMAVKRTYELIPFCHPVPLEDFLCTIYHQLGIDSNKELLAFGTRTIEIVKGGKVVKGLIA